MFSLQMGPRIKIQMGPRIKIQMGPRIRAKCANHFQTLSGEATEFNKSVTTDEAGRCLTDKAG